jgi:Ca2+-binding RTX toxin-like protein
VLLGGAGADTLIGGKGNDTLGGGSNPEGPAGQGDILLGGEGDDTYRVDSGLDLVDEGFIFPAFGFGGFDTILSNADFYWDTQSVGERVVVLEGVVDAGNDGVTIVGGVFNNTIEGHKGTDVLFGRGGSDTYRAGDGIDFISLSTLGLTDANAYVGVDGVNTVIVEQRTSGPTSYDIVFEFESGKDKVDVSDYRSVNGLTSGAKVLALAVNDGAGNCYIPLGDGFDYLYMVGLEKADLVAEDFIV